MRKMKDETEPFAFLPFEGLKRNIERKGIRLGSHKIAAVKEKVVSDEELFINAMSAVKEIPEYREIRVRQRVVAAAKKKRSADCEVLTELREIVRGHRQLNLCDTQEYVEWVGHVCHRGMLKRLQQGLFSVQDCLDLHGLILEDAETVVEQFLREARRNGLRCVKIIHGRGLRSPAGPVLKKALIRSLTGRFRKKIIAFTSARQCDGGLGALYVLLH